MPIYLDNITFNGFSVSDYVKQVFKSDGNRALFLKYSLWYNKICGFWPDYKDGTAKSQSSIVWILAAVSMLYISGMMFL